MTTEERLALDAELWVVEELLFSAKRRRLADQLVARGLTPEQARDQVARVEHSAGLARLRARLATARRSEALDRLRRELDPPDAQLATASSVDRDTLWRDHWIRGRPLSLPGWGRQLPLATTWTFDALSERFGHVDVQVNVDRDRAQRPSEVERYQQAMSFADLLTRTRGAPADEVYAVSRSGLLAEPGLAPLWNDLTDPPAPLVPPTPPRGVALWIGPAGTHTRAHYDPHNVILMQVQGRKRVRMAPPPPPAQAAAFDGWYLATDLQPLHEVELAPGDALFLPAGWLHEVHALEPSITLSWMCFGWPNHFHFLGPTGADDV